jgi:hypothetical protein
MEGTFVQRLSVRILIIALVCVLTGGSGHSAFAQQRPSRGGELVPAGGQPVPVGGQIKADSARLVSTAAQRGLPRIAPAVRSPASGAGEDVAIPFRPATRDPDYRATKAAAQPGAPGPLAPSAPRPQPRGADGPGARAPLAPPAVVAGPIDGVDQSGCTFGTIRCRPPDPHLAAGAGNSRHVVEVGNSFLAVYNQGGERLLSTSLSAFFEMPPPPPAQNLLFDPRVVYDTVWNRWVVTADSRASSATEQLFHIGVSLTDDATGPYFLYKVNVTLAAGDFFDFPQLGMDQDAVIITANIFGSDDQFKYAEAFSIAKARLYNGLGFTVPVFTNLTGTLAPPIVQDQHPFSYLIAAPPRGSALRLYAMRETARPEATSLTLQADVPVEGYRFPPDATQPGSVVTIDTLDARFVNASTQVGKLLYQVHTIAFGAQGGPPTPKWYKIDIATNAALVQQFFYASETSNDWNASIAATARDEVFVTWSSDEPGRLGTNPEVRISGKQADDPAIPPGTSVEVSPSPYTANQSTGPVRWGDYSAVALDPIGTSGCEPFRRAWIANQKAKEPNVWGTTLARIGFC